MILSDYTGELRQGSIPRESGDDPNAGDHHKYSAKYSPRERG